MILASALVCLAANIYFEARGESLLGQQAVAQVTLNRSRDRNKSVCEVVTQKHQFSWTTGKIKQDKRGVWRIKKQYEPKDKTAWAWSMKVAKRMLTRHRKDVTFGALHYHATYVRPKWASSMLLTYREGRHVFFRKG